MKELHPSCQKIKDDEQQQIVDIKTAMSEGYDREFICNKYNLSRYKFYRIHAGYGRYFQPGKELNEQIKNKHKLNSKTVLAIKNLYNNSGGSITYKSLSVKFELPIGEILNILTFKKCNNVGKKYNDGIKRINTSRVNNLYVKYKKKEIDNFQPIVLNKFNNYSCEAFMDTELIGKNQKVDIILTSPPYNINRKYDQYHDSKPRDQYVQWIVDLHKQFDKILAKDRVVLLNLSYSAKDPSLPYKVVTEIEEKTNFSIVDTIIWEKPGCTTNSSAFNRLDRIVEPIFVLARKSETKTFYLNAGGFTIGKNGQKYSKTTIRNKIYCKNGKSNAGNISTYSVDLVKRLIEMYGKKGDLIYDPFMGTGTTGVGSVLSNCCFVGSELSEKQVKYSDQRIIKPTRYVKLKRILKHVDKLESSNTIHQAS
jgi:DNA modification methylase